MNFFRDRRVAMGKTQRTIAAEIEITDAAVGRWETNVAAPRISTAAKLAKVYGVTEARMVQEIAKLSVVVHTRALAASH